MSAKFITLPQDEFWALREGSITGQRTNAGLSMLNGQTSSLMSVHAGLKMLGEKLWFFLVLTKNMSKENENSDLSKPTKSWWISLAWSLGLTTDIVLFWKCLGGPLILRVPWFDESQSNGKTHVEYYVQQEFKESVVTCVTYIVFVSPSKALYPALTMAELIFCFIHSNPQMWWQNLDIQSCMYTCLQRAST